MKMDMKITDLIKKLEEVKAEHGNLLVVLPILADSVLVTVRSKDLLICTDGCMGINDNEMYVDEIDEGKVLVFGEW